jgi:hypothetical protein
LVGRACYDSYLHDLSHVLSEKFYSFSTIK